MQNLLSTHDTERIASHIANRRIGPYRDWAEHPDLSKGSNPDYDVEKPDADAVRTHQLCVVF